jgi:hypothetical protein
MIGDTQMAKDRMKKGGFLLIGLVLAVLLWQTTQVTGDELDELKQQLIELQDRISQFETTKIEQHSANKVDTGEQDKTENPALLEALNWTNKIKISGDFRYRHEHVDQEIESGGRTRWLNGSDRDRIRARLMLEAAINDDWDTTLRLATGTSRAPYSANQDLEDAFSSKEIWLDLAHFTWHPTTNKGLRVLGGKMINPYFKSGKNELIWDNDLNPEGIAAQYKMPLGKIDQLVFNGGGFWVDESTLDVDTSLWGGQAYWRHIIGSSDYLLAGTSYYDYGNLEGQSALSSTWSSVNLFFGNTSSGGLYKDDYNIFEAFGEYGFKFVGMPTAIFGSWVRNTAASTSEDTGWLIGAKFNKAEEPGSWEFNYDYRELDADAVVGGFTESDFLGGLTNSRGHKFGLKYQLSKHLQSGLNYYHLEETSSASDLDHIKLLADLVLKF